MKKLLALIVLFSLVRVCVRAGGIDFHHDKTFQELLDMAKAQDKLIFMDCYTSWCGPCKRLSSMIFPDSAVGAYFNDHFINCKFDMEKGEGITIAGRYNIRAYPTMLWIDGSGEVKHKVVGLLDTDGLIQNGEKALDPLPGILSGLHRQYNEGNRDVNFLADFVNAMNKAGEDYSEVFKLYVEKLTPKEFMQRKHSQTIFDLTKDFYSPGLTYLVKNKDYYSGRLGKEVYNTKIDRIAELTADEAAQKNDNALFKKAVELVENNRAGNAKQKLLELGMNYYARTNDWVNYDKDATRYIKSYAAHKSALINDIAWNYYLNVNDKAGLNKAVKWIHEVLQKEDKYTYNITYAYLLYKLNNLKEAEKACDYAALVAQKEQVQSTSADALKAAIVKALNP